MPTSVRPCASISGCAAARSARAVARIASVCAVGRGSVWTARRPREVAEAKPQDDGSPDSPGRPHPARDAVDERHERGVERLGRGRRAAERALRPDRAAAPARPHPPRVVVPRQRVELPARRAAEQSDQRLLAERRRRPRPSSSLTRVQLAGRRRPDAPEPLDRERMEKVELAVGLDDEQPVGLRDAARDLRQELRPRDPDRDRQADALAHVAPQPRRDLARRPGEPLASRARRETPRRSRAPRRAATRRRRPRTSPCSPPSTRASAAARRSRPGQRRRASPALIAVRTPHAFAS